MTSAYLELPVRTQADVRAHQLKAQIELEQKALYWERLSIELTDPQGRSEALAISVNYAARANKLRIANAALNWAANTPLQDADRQAARARDLEEKPWTP